MVAVRYMVDDVAAAKAFYVTRLGFRILEEWGDAMAIVEREGLKLWLAGPSSSAARAMPNGDKPQPGGWNRIVIAVDAIDEVVRQLAAAGVGLRNTVTRGPGGAQVLIEDPSGNPIELFEARRG
jgi:catechol 2,3-dioxygenase-like lactoylglutathione lyase family enzyme